MTKKRRNRESETDIKKKNNEKEKNLQTQTERWTEIIGRQRDGNRVRGKKQVERNIL